MTRGNRADDAVLWRPTLRRRAALRPPASPRVISNPADDASFDRWVTRLAAERDMTPDALQALLRFRYPHAVVRRREIAGELTEVWYAFREGRWIAPHSGDGPGASGPRPYEAGASIADAAQTEAEWIVSVERRGVREKIE